MEEEYRRLHADCWPDIRKNLRAAHIRNYSIFLRDGMLFGYLEYEGEDYVADMAALAARPETQRWRQLTSACQTPIDGAAPGEWWAAMTEVFHLD
jgi:L-rhamnose mutarotase